MGLPGAVDGTLSEMLASPKVLRRLEDLGCRFRV